MYATLVSGPRRLPGERLEARVKRAAGGLARLGLQPGSPVGLLLRNDFAVIELMLAAERAGLVAVPLNWHGAAQAIAQQLAEAPVRVLFAHADLLPPLRARLPVPCRVFTLRAPPEVREAYGLEAMGGLDPAEDYEAWLANAPALDEVAPPPASRLFYTSGSTGRPTPIRRLAATPAAAARIAARTLAAHGLDQRPIRAAMPGPLYHSATAIYALNCVRHGELLALQPRFDAEALLQLIEAEGLTHLHLVPRMFQLLLALPAARRRGFDPSRLVSVVHGAAPCPEPLKAAMIDWWGPVIGEYYGAAELGVIAACSAPEWLAHRGTVGRAPAGVEIRIGDADEIFIRSEASWLLRGIQGEAGSAPASASADGWVSVGDAGRLDAEGFLWIRGRLKDRLRLAGAECFPGDIEAAVLGVAGVRDCIAFGVPTATPHGDGHDLVVDVEPVPGALPDLGAIRAAIAGVARSAPAEVRIVADLGREDSGKLSRHLLRQRYLQSLLQP